MLRPTFSLSLMTLLAATTLAERGAASMMDISPKVVPARMVLRLSESSPPWKSM